MIASQLAPRAAFRNAIQSTSSLHANTVGQDLGKIDLKACGRTRALRKGQCVRIRTDGKRSACQDFIETACVSAVRPTKQEDRRTYERPDIATADHSAFRNDKI